MSCLLFTFTESKADSTYVAKDNVTPKLVLKVNGRKSKLYKDVATLPEKLSEYELKEIDCPENKTDCTNTDFSYLVAFLRNKSDYMFTESLKIIIEDIEEEIYFLDGDNKYSKGKRGISAQISNQHLMDIFAYFEDNSVKLVYTICTDSTYDKTETIEFDMTLKVTTD